MKNLEVCGGCNAKIAAGNLDKLTLWEERSYLPLIS